MTSISTALSIGLEFHKQQSERIGVFPHIPLLEKRETPRIPRGERVNPVDSPRDNAGYKAPSRPLVEEATLLAIQEMYQK